MNKAMTWIKSHPYLTGAIVIVVGLAAYMILSARGVGGGVQYVDGGSAGPTDAQVAAQAQLQMAQVAAGVQTAGYSAQIAMAQYQGQTDIALADRSLDATLAGIAAQLGMNQQNTAAQRDVALAQINSNVIMSGQQADMMKLMVLAMAKPKTIKQLGKTGILGSSTSTLPTSGLLPSVSVDTLGNSGHLIG